MQFLSKFINVNIYIIEEINELYINIVILFKQFFKYLYII
jgi:hypothetical protein